MKYLHRLVLLLIIIFSGYNLFLIGCHDVSNHVPLNKTTITKEESVYFGTREYDHLPVTTVEIDGCEYLYTWFGAANGGGSFTHKGNCKYCAMRNQNINVDTLTVHHIKLK